MRQISVANVLTVLFYAFCIVIDVNGSSDDGTPFNDSRSIGAVKEHVPKDLIALLGKFKDFDESELESPEIQEIAEFATNEIASRKNSETGYNLVKVVAAQRQVVEGLNYNLSLQVIPNQCDRTKQSEDPDDNPVICPDGPCKKAKFCKARVYTVPWMDKKSLVSLDCRPDHSACGKDPET